MGDAWFINPHATINTIRRQMTVYRAELTAAGKAAPRELPMVKEVFCATNRAAAIEMAGPYRYRNTATTPSGAKTRSCPTIRISPARSMS